MAPDIALQKIQKLSPGQMVLDPMSGSGMVLSQAVRNGVCAIGVDLDPLAELISRVGASTVDETLVVKCLDALLKCCFSDSKEDLFWIDSDVETKKFIDFWYAPKQIFQLRKLAYHIYFNTAEIPKSDLDVIKVALSRLIVTKDPKASLARDTAHSRPHRTISENGFDVFAALGSSLKHVLSVLNCSDVKASSTTYIGDARNLTMVDTGSVDSIVTSPPYLNAIDYMRGHRMSLVWFGHKVGDLRKLRSITIGAERAGSFESSTQFHGIINDLGLESVAPSKKRMLERYFIDLCEQSNEAYRVLKRGAVATYVIGNSTIQGHYIRNSELLKIAGKLAGFDIVSEVEREIPNNRRYMPINGANSLAKRMRKEHVIDFVKPSAE